MKTLRIADLFCGAGGTSTGAAQGFPRGYQFTGTKTEQVRQIGNAVPCGFARALIAAHLTQDGDVTETMRRAA